MHLPRTTLPAGTLDSTEVPLYPISKRLGHRTHAGTLHARIKPTREVCGLCDPAQYSALATPAGNARRCEGVV